jgi:hypothetical protein
VRLDERVRRGVVRVGRRPADRVRRGREARGAPAERRVVGRQHERAAGRLERAGDHELGVGQVVERADAVLAEVVGGDVGHARRVGAAHGEPPPQHPAARRFEHRRGDAPVAEDEARAARPGPVACLQLGVGTGAGHAHAVGAARPDHVPRRAQRRRDDARGGGLPVRPGDERERHPADRGPVDRVGVGERAGGPGAAARARRPP